jgi:methyl-accepting chemotaxis protein
MPRRGAEKPETAMEQMQHRARQIKEIVRLGSLLRVEMSLQDIFELLVTSINRTLGFKVAALNLVQTQDDHLAIVATAGLSTDDRHRLTSPPPELSRLKAAMRPEFRISNSYFIGHEHQYLLEGAGGVTVYSPTPPNAVRGPDAWHPEDVLLVPLLSPRDGRMFGILSLDQPVDGRRPSEETIEIIEIFATQAALAIENSLFYHEHEHERKQMERGLAELLGTLQHVRQGDLSVRSQVQGSLLSLVAQSLNAVLTALDGLLTEVRAAGQVVNANAGETRTSATQLATTSQEQARQLVAVSGEIATLAESMQRIAATATAASTEALEAIELSNSGRDFAERAAVGMEQVREVVLESAKKIRRLGEHTQEIGQIVQTVSDFAQQTNLLALNAAIEAARAGDGNSAFTLFATEIRTLANNSADAAKQIAARITAIQNETNTVVVTIEHSTEQVVRQSELAAQAGTAMEAVDLATQRVASAIHSINASAAQQAQTARNISAAMGDVAQVSDANRDRMEEMRASMDDLVERANALLAKIRFFRLGATTSPDLRPSGQTAGPMTGQTFGPQPAPTRSPRLTQPLAGPVPRLAPLAPSAPLPLASPTPIIQPTPVGPAAPPEPSGPSGPLGSTFPGTSQGPSGTDAVQP